ncbi:AMP-binding protein [Streptomyces sp. NPDC101234]|uniref:AMP-binding protein n=1 Tax=Streptomyces sp. NPDC101234 TaxID=3366138 RepID=UPI003817AB05
MSAARLRRAGEVFGPVVYGWYGQTEASLITEVRPHEHTLLGRMGQVTAGRPVPGVEIAVCGETGGQLPAGRSGEIRVGSPQVMTGHWRQPELNAEVLHDGWLCTGDAGYLDEEGYLYIAGRYKQMIKLAVGLQVFPPSWRPSCSPTRPWRNAWSSVCAARTTRRTSTRRSSRPPAPTRTPPRSRTS